MAFQAMRWSFYIVSMAKMAMPRFAQRRDLVRCSSGVFTGEFRRAWGQRRYGGRHSISWSWLTQEPGNRFGF
jgi:hypothetical protein